MTDEFAEEIAVANVDDTPTSPSPAVNTRPRRANAGAGVERLQMDFQGKEYGAKREFNLANNEYGGEVDKANRNMDKYMNIVCNIIFTQMSAKVGFKKFRDVTVAEMIKEFT